MNLDGFMARTRQVGDCLIWTGAQTVSEQDRIYGVIRHDGRRIRAHRWIYERLVGSIPDGLLLRHSCDTPLCVNIRHLTPGSDADNAQDREERGRNYWRQRTHCPRDHPYDEENTHINKNGHRSCKTCRREQDRERKRRLRNPEKVDPLSDLLDGRN